MTSPPRRRTVVEDRGPGVVPFGVLLGATGTGTGTGPMAGILGAALIYGESAQLTAITVLHLGAGRHHRRRARRPGVRRSPR